ncbi:MAG: hypothetical protein QW038_00605 [Nanopusillaceae archaeon]
MKSINLYLEYIFIFLISLSTIYFVYNYYESSKISLSIFFIEKKEDVSIKTLDFYISNILNFYNYSKSLDLEINGFCLNNYSIFYKNFNCMPNTIEIDYIGDIIKYNNYYYFYSNNTKKYYKIFIRSPISFEGCYEDRYSYIIQTNFCDIFCFKNCKINIKKEGKNLQIFME